MNVLLLGPQGSGKGTQATRISAEYGLPHVATGDIFRDAVARQTELGRRVQPILDRGELVPDELTIALIRDRLDRGDAAPGFVLDGFPRNLAQADALEDLLRELGLELDVVLLFQLDDDVAIERMRGRAREEGRSDDTLEVMRRRLDIYREQTAPLVEYYRARHANVVGIHADRGVDDVFGEIRAALDHAAQRPRSGAGRAERAWSEPQVPGGRGTRR